MRSVFVLEKVVYDKLGRTKKVEHVGVFNTLDNAESKKQNLLKDLADSTKIGFNIYCSENVF